MSYVLKKGAKLAKPDPLGSYSFTDNQGWAHPWPKPPAGRKTIFPREQLDYRGRDKHHVHCLIQDQVTSPCRTPASGCTGLYLPLGGNSSAGHKHSRSQMRKQNFEACAVGAAVATMKWRSLGWKNQGKESERIRAQNPRRFRKWGGPRLAPRR